MVDVTGTLRADLHTHSTASDGTLAPAELISESARLGLSHVALTDHDTTGGVLEALETGQRVGVVVIAGIEFSCDINKGELHILGYGIDPANAELQNTVATLRETRSSRAARILDKLDDLGISLDRSILRREHADDSIGRPHIARALIEAGVVSTVSEAFDRFLGRGMPAFVPKALMAPDEAIALIHRAGGLAVMAHPFSVPEPETIVSRLVASGLDGLECHYGEYTVDQRHELQNLANRLGLLQTGGSDYHGPAFREGRELGSVPIPDRAVRIFLDALAGKSAR